MRSDLVRIGRISSINQDTGMVRVTYADRDNASTKEFPVLRCTDEYRDFQIGERVVVLHLSNGNSRAVVLGGLWNTLGQKQKSIKSRITDILTSLVVNAIEDIILKSDGNITLEDANWTTSLSEIMERLNALDGNDTGRKKG